PGSFLIARAAQHRDYLARELAQSQGWGADVREADPALVAGRASYYRASGQEFALWCPEDVYIEEPASLIRAYLAACRRRGGGRGWRGRGRSSASRPRAAEWPACRPPPGKSRHRW